MKTEKEIVERRNYWAERLDTLEELVELVATSLERKNFYREIDVCVKMLTEYAYILDLMEDVDENPELTGE